MNDNLATLMPAVCGVAERAAAEIMAIYRDESRWQVQEKEDASPLTAADLAANRVIVAGLRALTPDIPVISEECEETPFAERSAWPRCWMVDPLDGTREFIARNDEFSVNIALIEGDRAVLGVVHAPVTGISWCAARGHGAWRIEGHRRIPLQVARFPQRGGHAPRLVMSRRHRGDQDMAFAMAVEKAMGQVELTAAGSAFKICAVAEGTADAYPRFGPTMEWDTAAGQVVVEEAGGALLDAQGRPFRYNRRAGLRNGNFLVAGAEPEKWMDFWRVAR
jgi:3'(2'), 5'-bisphosphate nucleotidase